MEGRGGSDGERRWWRWREEVVAMEGGGGGDGGRRWWRWREEVVVMEGGGGGDGGCKAGEGGVSFFAPVTVCLHSEWDTNPS